MGTITPQQDNFRIVPDFPAYCVTRDGTVWSRYRKGSNQFSEVWKPKSPFVANRGHLRVALHGDTSKQYFVHVLVLECFVGPRPEGMQCCHINGNPKDNRLENLRWGTPESNWDDKREHGTATIGTKQTQAKIRESDVLEIFRLRSEGFKLKDIAARFSISIAKVHQILAGKNWKHVSEANCG
jgi:hypothetical protein